MKIKLILLTLMIAGFIQAFVWQLIIAIYLLNGQRVYIYEDYLPIAIIDIIVFLILIMATMFIAIDYMIMLADKDIRGNK